MNLEFKITFWFVPGEKPTTRYIRDDKEANIKAAFLTVATERYPTTFKINPDVKTFFIMRLNNRIDYVGDHVGINARFVVTPVLRIEDRTFELKEIRDSDNQ